MYDSLGLIAGRGLFPLLFCQEARKAGVKKISVVAFHDETSREVENLADAVDWLYVGQLGKAIKSFKKQNVGQVAMAGQIKPGKLFKGMRPDLKAFLLLASLKERNAESIFSAVADLFLKNGMEIISSVTFMEKYLAAEGTMGKVRLNKARQKDMEFGCRIAKEVSSLDIGQCVVVKKGTVLAKRSRFINELNDMYHEGGTPLSETLYEAALYYQGKNVDYPYMFRSAHQEKSENDAGSEKIAGDHDGFS